MKRWIFRGVLVVILLAITVARVTRQTHSAGLPARIVTTQCMSRIDVIGRRLRLLIADDGGMFINSDSVPPAQMSARLAEIYSTRNERILFFDAADSVSYQQAVAVLDKLQSAVPGLTVILITPSTRKECEPLWEPIRDVIPGDLIPERRAK